MIRLFYAPGACSMAPHLVLEWIGAPYEAVRVRYGAPEFLTINPAGAVPALDTGEGWTLTQAGAILHYLARRFPEAKLAPVDDPRAEAEADRWSSFFTGDLHPSFYPVFMPDRYTTATDAAALDAVREAGLILVRKRLRLLDDHLRGKAFILGDRRSVIDAYAFPMLRWASAKLPEGLSDFAEARRHLEAMSADGAARKVLADEGLA
ncbi:glutathione S-transferase family protein [Methylobacterium sp. sgz302541]|uniref:glutathione S-transferase family protein n=1 Tax=unclassified Methylobacterium TaxID=2615210 RepID=UPI003D328835